MQLRVFTLRFSHSHQGFDDGPLQAFIADKQVVEVTDHFFVHENVPYLTLLVSYRDVEGPERYLRGRKDDARAQLDAEERRVYEALRTWRAATARQEGIPPYMILNNRQVAECVKIRAKSKTDLAQINGIGEAKVARYGDRILEILAPTVLASDGKAQSPGTEVPHGG